MDQIGLELLLPLPSARIKSVCHHGQHTYEQELYIPTTENLWKLVLSLLPCPNKRNSDHRTLLLRQPADLGSVEGHLWEFSRTHRAAQ